MWSKKEIGILRENHTRFIHEWEELLPARSRNAIVIKMVRLKLSTRTKGRIPEPPKISGLGSDFWSKVPKKEANECWEWEGSVNNGGYGYFVLNGKFILAHRFSWEIHNGPIQKSKSTHDTCICHKCDNKMCVNPNHLFLGTQKDNVIDMMRKGIQVPRGNRESLFSKAKGRGEYIGQAIEIGKIWFE